MVTDEYDFDAFGTELSTSGSTLNAHRWKGESLAYYREPDAAPSLQYALHFRNYDPLTGTFPSRDPAEDDSNLYRYVKNNPLNASDPSGLTETDDHPRSPGNMRLIDVDRDIEKIINDAIFSSMVEIVLGGSKSSLPALVYDKLGRNIPGSGVSIGVGEVAQLTGIEVLIEKNLSVRGTASINKIPFETSIYGNTPVGLIFANGFPSIPKSGTYPAWLSKAGANHAIAPTIQIKGVLMGTDKFGHFAQQGYWLFKAVELGLIDESEIEDLSRWWEGDPKTPADKKTRKKLEYASSIVSGGSVTTFGYFGSYSTGIISQADSVANRMGYDFYKKLNEDLLHKFSIVDYSREQLEGLNEWLNPSSHLSGVIVSHR
jgi:RHS repeat-associated protein